MSAEDDFRIRPGRIRSSRAQRARPFIAQALAAAQKAGGRVSRYGRITSGNRSQFGRGRRASVQANRVLTRRSRNVVIKTRVVRHSARAAPLGAHLKYLQRDGVTRDGEKARLFGAELGEVDAKDFAERCEDDRHHFRFIVSPEDASRMTDLQAFARDLMSQMEKDLGTKLDWVGVDHWNTDNPHVHIILRGRTDDGQDLVIARDYIKEGMRARAQDLVTQDLGLRSDLEIHANLERQVEAERWTDLDRQLMRDGYRTGVIDVAPHPDRQPDEYLPLKVGRLRKLEALGLAEEIGPGQWTISEKAEPTLRELGERGDIIKRMHRALTERGIDRGSASYVLAAESLDDPIVGRLVERGLDDELKGTAYAVVDGVDGRTHHIKFPDLDATGDSAPGSIVELRKFDDAQGRRRVALAVRSDLDIAKQVTATGATWLDRQNIAREPASLSEGGFGAEVRDALDSRAEHLIEKGFAERQGRSVIFNRNLLRTLRQREVDALADRIAGQTGRAFNQSGTGEFVAGTYRQRFTLASGRFAMIDDGLGFQLVPWSPSLEKQLAKHVSGVARSDGGVDWSFGRKRGIGL
ncbi:relaxase/mobilization nuclease domain-containing protein [Polymorphum gilvum]|jgi:type IV secretory pathway VirD2 relaxase|uniref:Type IV secretory pathway VirD2 components (Relaxase)-like protein n=1 Tax=Polymorphum gilvum (strain LMG 25793 / CGMCC 1.9160 / SL003B-26A1) TaxID=991905 RepID=F2J181_POLGS|nr:VirD2 family relaxase/mobilization nuclease [Polymorphum gilvum]ADZ68727.1 Type IV secretory pathway VirD2 components (Relaxase)-like protein [Polymorphum gilvum SL003B-26A1]